VSYTLLKTIHMTSAAISYTLFLVRGIWRFSGSPLAAQRWTRVVPHVNDTVLLLAAIAMAVQIARYPGFHAFLAAKTVGLVVYILLGMAAFRWAATRGSRMAAWLAAQAVFFYIVAVALTKRPGLGLI
jgi:uncharacterized membrane protein SirB2